MNNILVEVLGSVAQAEREKIRLRQSEGIAAAKKQGKHTSYVTVHLVWYLKNHEK